MLRTPCDEGWEFVPRTLRGLFGSSVLGWETREQVRPEAGSRRGRGCAQRGSQLALKNKKILKRETSIESSAQPFALRIRHEVFSLALNEQYSPFLEREHVPAPYIISMPSDLEQLRLGFSAQFATVRRKILAVEIAADPHRFPSASAEQLRNGRLRAHLLPAHVNHVFIPPLQRWTP